MEVGENGAGVNTGIDLISSLLKIPDISMVSKLSPNKRAFYYFNESQLVTLGFSNHSILATQ